MHVHQDLQGYCDQDTGQKSEDRLLQLVQSHFHCALGTLDRPPGPLGPGEGAVRTFGVVLTLLPRVLAGLFPLRGVEEITVRVGR